MGFEIKEFKNLGMKQDSSPSKREEEFAFENHNVRITSLGDSTLLSVTNEVGPKEVSSYRTKKLVNNSIYVGIDMDNLWVIESQHPVDTNVTVIAEVLYSNGFKIQYTSILNIGDKSTTFEVAEDDLLYNPTLVSCQIIPDTSTDSIFKYYYHKDKPEGIFTEVNIAMEGDYIHHCLAGKYIIVFTDASVLADNIVNNIYRLELNDEGNFTQTLLYSGEGLGLTTLSKIETLYYYESEEIQKVYWVDGEHSNRVINIKRVYDSETCFDFVPVINKFPNLRVSKLYESAGRFYAGVINYYITYYNKYGSETGIVAVSDINRITPQGRGGKVNENCDCSFRLQISNIDTSFDYIRVYSAQRTSIDGPIEVHVVKDIKITEDTVEIDDTNINQVVIDSSMLNYLGGYDFTASTLCQKDNTLFLGNLSIGNLDMEREKRDIISNSCIEDSDIKKCKYAFETLYHSSTNYKSSTEKYFKCGEIYRLAIQFQDNKGMWTSPIWIGDYNPKLRPDHGYRGHGYNPKKVVITPVTEFVYPGFDIDEKYVNYRILRAETNYNNRSVIAQGIVCPTLFNYEDRYYNRPFSTASWIFRPAGGDVPYRHLEGMRPFGEIQSVMEDQPIPKVTAKKGVAEIVIIASGPLGYNTENQYNICVVKLKKGVSVLDATRDDVEVLYEYQFPHRNDDSYDVINLACSSLGLNLSKYVDRETFKSRDPINWYWASTGLVDIFYKDSIPWGLANITPAYYTTGTIESNTEYSDVDDVKNKKDLFYIDNNIVTFHTPNIDNVFDIVDNKELKFRIVGYNPIKSTKSDTLIETSTVGVGYKTDIIKPNVNNKTLVSDFLYKDYALIGNSYSSLLTYTYKVHMWNKTNSLSGWVKGLKLDSSSYSPEQVPAKLKHKIFANYRESDIKNYKFFDPIDYGNVSTVVFNSDEITTKVININDKTLYYYGNYDKLLTDVEYKMESQEGGVDQSNVAPIQTDSIRIRYKSTPHIVFGLPDYKLLPYNTANSSAFNIDSLYPFNTVETDKYPWEDEGVEYTNNNLFVEGIDAPLVYVGELYRDIPYDSLYGGYQEDDLERITWIPASDICKIGEDTVLRGDVSFSDWECLKTYPFTEEDENSVVDITRVRLESFEVLEGRSDINQGGNNILNARPANFNIFNSVYNQSDNIFKYYILDEKYDIVKFSNQITWSLSKTPNEDIDVWTGITLASVLNLDGEYGSVNKLENVNNNIVVFQDKGIAAIQYNERTQLSTESGLPVEIQNSGKVTGYQYISNSIGCINKYSIVKTLSGVYFIDDLNKSFNRFGKDGVVNVSELGMRNWFLTTDLSKFRIYYDSITHDVYIGSKDTVLAFNEDLKAFSSFYNYLGNASILNLNGKTYAITMGNNIKTYELFGGSYGVGFDGKPINYSIEYLVNPEPSLDKTFTNLEFSAEMIDPSKNSNNPEVSVNSTPFDSIQVWNEYQYGSSRLERGFRDTLSRRFRLWRTQIPRDEKSKFKHDRMRSPWIHLKLSKDACRDKMVFHNMIIKYYK